MLARLRQLLARDRSGPGTAALEQHREPAPDEVRVGGHVLRLPPLCTVHYGLPMFDWRMVYEWVDRLDEARRNEAWTACERAWLLRMREALGAGYRLDETAHAAVVSSLDPGTARATLDYIERTLRRIHRILDGIAGEDGYGKEVLLVFDDEQRYYEYVSFYYPEEGEFATSGGMYLSGGCNHFVTVKADLAAIEPVIAHEMTHGCVSHLPLPLWLNEGMAVNMEWRLAGSRYEVEKAAELRLRHPEFWNAQRIQEFWSGKSFESTGAARSLSYDLARVIAQQLAKDWEAFKRFVLAAHRDDGGASAARLHLGVDLGAYAAVLTGHEPDTDWAPAVTASDQR